MYDDYEIESLSNEFYAYELDEMLEHHTHMQNIQEYDAYNDDDDYARDSCDYSDLAYRHYA
jgi:hypothetical protein